MRFNDYALTPRQIRAEKKAVVTNLTKARRLIAKPERWIKGTFFQSKEGYAQYNAAGAYAYCALGAIKKADGKGEDGAVRTLALAVSELFYKSKRTTNERVFTFNDKKGTKHEDILAAFDRALEIAQAEAEAAAAESNES